MSLARSTDDIADLVGDYLLKHPDFLNDNPHILENLRLSHATGRNIASLIELQVHRLQESRRYQQQQIDYLHTASEADQQRVTTVQAAALDILQTNNGRLHGVLFKHLHNLFNTDHLNIYLFSDQPASSQLPDIQVKPRDCRLQRMFTELFNRNKPLCDSLQQEYITLLFGKTSTVSSTLLLPYTDGDECMLFALGSQRMNVYRQGFELGLTRFLIDIYRIRSNQVFTDTVTTG